MHKNVLPEKVNSTMQSQSKPTIRVIAFPGIQNLPHFAALTQGYYDQRQIHVDLHYTQSSEEQRTGLANHLFDLAHSAVDNALEMVLHSKLDIKIVVGLDQAFNQLVTRRGIIQYKDLIGKTLGVDAPDTAFALVAFEMLKLHGIQPGQYEVLAVGATAHRLEALKNGSIDFSLMTLPFNLLAKESGLSFLDRPFDTIGTYQSTGGFVHHQWAKDHASNLVNYLAAYISGLRWALNPINQIQVIGLIEKHLKLHNDLAKACYAQVTHPVTGFFKDAQLSHEGMLKVIELRQKFENSTCNYTVDRFYDETFYQRAIRLI